MAHHLRRLLALTVLGLIVAGVAAVAHAQAPALALGAAGSAGSTAKQAAAQTRDDETVFAYIGANFNQVLAFDPRAQSVTVDFYMWLRWRGDMDLTSSIELVNVWGSEHIMTPDRPAARVLEDGERYQSWHVQGDFATPLDFTEYPRDTQTLTIKVEDAAHDVGELVLLPEAVTSGPEFASIPAGYELSRPPTDAVVVEHTYPSNFGLPGAKASTYSQAQFSFDVTRPLRSYLGKSFLPLAIVVLITLMGYLLGPARVDSRVALAVTAMVSAVLLHMEADAVVPPTASFLRIDWIFLTGYVVILIGLVESILAVHVHDSGADIRARRMDGIAAAVSAVLFVAGVAVALS